MNIITISKQTMLLLLREPKSFLFMLAFPLVMMLILGSALGSAFNEKVDIGTLRVGYHVEGSPQVKAAFTQFMKATVQDVRYQEVTTTAKGKNDVKLGNRDGYVEVNDQGVHYYKSEQTTIQSSVIEGMLAAFADRYHLAKEIGLSGVKDEVANVVSEESLTAKKAPRSMDYYGVVVTTMITLYSAIGASFLLRGERTRNTAIRLGVAPISKGEIFLGKIIGSVLMNSGIIAVLMIVGSLLFHVNWGEHLGYVILVLLSQIVFAVSVGVGVSYVVATGEGARSLLLILIQVASFFGGAYFKIDHPEGFMNILVHLSPLQWANSAILSVIYNDQLSAILPVISLNIGLAALFLTFSAVTFRKREGF
ncbi:hypothetical protein A374_02504 [Fictibacillus macauensis ZFHKF-1]|uniref:ABC-2 type transporter transmembrane domain-containing protein n=1 Tax=Fictibacillus macauensis ZFHKF-1 TaxID=1196324 RepID=I8UJU4_9BACL|nr:ABC transporter permease [Fictibacillus macauensis]EIT87088.1 hypothetical protein A374_02504 [Fictibacillus macauensis ZFHKF-1]